MGVSVRIRKVEDEIDCAIRTMAVWQWPKAALLTYLMQTYRDAIEAIFCVQFFFHVHGNAMDDSADKIGALFAKENCIRGGVLWALKWASDFCQETGPAPDAVCDELAELLCLGSSYETFVDALKYANHGLVDIHVDELARTLICYEGEQATAFDASIVHHQRITVPATQHVSLTEDTDQITSRWTAGDYRRVTKNLAAYAAGKENTITVDPAYLTQIGKSDISLPQPTLVWLERPREPPDSHVFDDLLLPPVIDGGLKWKLVALLDTPVVKIGQRYCALSSDLKAIAEIDDHMLRLAARVDPNRYVEASGLREGRMIEWCKEALGQHSPPWSIQSRVRYSNPSQEADVLATRDTDSIVLELKSTLRPETPWEVSKRNEDIMAGVRQAKALIDRDVAKRAYVITDGYRGDYACWKEALSTRVPIATLHDLNEIASDPTAAVAALKARVGIVGSASAPREPLPDRELQLKDWTLRLVDKEAPEGH